MAYEEIDYTKLNDRIVKQAYDNLEVLGKRELEKLIEGKFERAKHYQQAFKMLQSVE